MNATQLLREHGLKATAPRIAILDALARRQSPVSAPELARKLNGKLDPASVYRGLQSLVECGLVRRIDLDRVAKYFELQRDDDHHHVVCIRCQKIEDVHDSHTHALDQNVLKESKLFAKITAHRLEFFGVCTSCSR